MADIAVPHPREVFELEGHEVLEAHSLATARAVLDEDEVDVVVLDVHLRGERSDPLVDECHAREPAIPGEGATAEDKPAPGFRQTLEAVKPMECHGWFLFCQMANRAAGKDAELEVVARDCRL